MTSKLRGADIVARAIERAGIRPVFTLSGNHIMPVFDATIDTKLELIHVRHEAAAVHMADAWARITGQAGVALVTGGPGHANAISALYTALASESPVVLLSGHAPLAQLGSGAFQEMPQAELATPVVKAAWTADDAHHVGHDVARAIRTALSGRPGPVHLSLPIDVLDAAIDAPSDVIPPDSAFQPVPRALDAGMARSILTTLAASRRPLILTGPVMANARGRRLCRDLESATDIPIVTMESPRGINDPSLGAFAEVLAEADCVVLLGKRADFTLGFARPPVLDRGCTIIRIDPDAGAYERASRAFSEFIEPVRVVVADTAAAAASLIQEAPASTRGHGGWCELVHGAIDYRPSEWAGINSSAGEALHPAELCRAVQPILDANPDAVLISDGGEFGQWAQACLKAPNRIINGPAGAIGSAIPFAAAARMAERNAPIIAMLGDGTAGFHCAEFDTAVRYGLPYVAVIGNDACWNAEYQIQLRNYGPQRLVGCELLPARYDKVAEALGGHGEYVTTAAELPRALQRALQCGLPACVNVSVARLPAPLLRRPVG